LYRLNLPFGYSAKIGALFCFFGAQLGSVAGASATEFYWTRSGSLERYSSATEACLSYVFHPSAGAKLVGLEPVGLSIGRPEYNHMNCRWYSKTMAHPLGEEHFYGGAFRQGVSCSVGRSYNLITGQCTFDGGKGDPGSACGPGGSGGGGGPSSKGPSILVGNPINFANGNKYQREVDYYHGGLEFSRNYNSLDALWRHGYSAHLRIHSYALVMVHSDGREVFFKRNGVSVIAPGSEYGVLEKVESGWAYRSPLKETFNFDEQGRLSRIAFSGGYKEFSYNLSSVEVRDNLGRVLTFSVRPDGQPASLNVEGVSVVYTYNSDNLLAQVKRTQSGQESLRKYHYEDVLNSSLLTGITDEKGARYASWSYDEHGRAISSEHAYGVERNFIEYKNNSSTVTNAFGKKTVYEFKNIADAVRIVSVKGEPSANCPSSNSTFTYDERGLLKTKADNKGHLTTYDYNTRGLEVSRTEAAGTPQARTITTDWHPTLFLPVTVTEPTRTTTYTYDAQGRQLSQSVTQR